MNLKKTYELPMIRKLGLGDKFPRKLLCVRKLALDKGIIDPNTAIDMLALKLHVGSKKMKWILVKRS